MGRCRREDLVTSLQFYTKLWLRRRRRRRWLRLWLLDCVLLLHLLHLLLLLGDLVPLLHLLLLLLPLLQLPLLPLPPEFRVLNSAGGPGGHLCPSLPVWVVWS